MKPITPEQVIEARADSLPDEVIKAFNELIIQNFDGTSSRISQDEVIDEILENFDGALTRQDIFTRDYLSVETFYQKAGWVVEYDKPGVGDTGEATFTFTKWEPLRTRREDL